MADSNITKRALASALKDLMQQIPFQKISVADVCQKCDMNRKSFYYHFRDKYELMNWIFDMDFIKVMDTAPADDPIAALMALGRIMYDNRGFYRNVLAVQGQNSLREHIHEILRPLLQERLKEALIDEDSSFYVEFFRLFVKCWGVRAQHLTKSRKKDARHNRHAPACPPEERERAAVLSQ